MNLMIHFSMTLIITVILIMLNLSLEQNFLMNKASKSNVECGFNSMTKLNFKFSNQFFMISIIFLIFDMELIILMPLPISSMSMFSFSMMFSIVILLAFSLMMEWISGLIEWTK